MTAVAPPLLRFEGISKRFGGTQAVDRLTLDLQAGEEVQWQLLDRSDLRLKRSSPTPVDPAPLSKRKPSPK